MKESDITKSILKELKVMGVFAWKHWSGAFSKRGVSDILGVLPPDGRALAIEVKAGNNGTSKYQESFLKDVREAGGLAFVATSVEDVKLQLIEAEFKPLQGDLFFQGVDVKHG